MDANLARASHLAQGAAVGPQLHRLLRDRIIRGDIPPGSRISETEIAAAYSVSRQPVREAFIKLAEEILVEVRPQRGTFVSLISVPAVITARFIREAVEADIVRRVAEVADTAALRILDARMGEQIALPVNAPGEDFMRLDEEFHRALAELAGQAAVADRLEEMKIHMNRVRHISARQFSRERLIAQHAEVVEAIRARDPQRAEAGMRTHLREILMDLPGIVASCPDFFEGREGLEAIL
ncbi:MAG: GntR family transcriptional regulator [Paracoccus sp. (in: a-proteobacteria)]|uniref:GntR family transcriptional regulator n=1 Tax=Paracoccus sp. TaxID=267 RepID=UPI0026DF3C05|nr:GntR family transcriptional regulator [Paracoccus sp. (in: a-proteobacteria)]MDO5613078.1 GntR family transcriptional regulator [Paracoccus sp. (in: a-proteobacteria)]